MPNSEKRKNIKAGEKKQTNQERKNRATVRRW